LEKVTKVYLIIGHLLVEMLQPIIKHLYLLKIMKKLNLDCGN